MLQASNRFRKQFNPPMAQGMNRPGQIPLPTQPDPSIPLPQGEMQAPPAMQVPPAMQAHQAMQAPPAPMHQQLSAQPPIQKLPEFMANPQPGRAMQAPIGQGDRPTVRRPGTAQLDGPGPDKGAIQNFIQTAQQQGIDHHTIAQFLGSKMGW